MAKRTPKNQSRSQYHSYWGEFAYSATPPVPSTFLGLALSTGGMALPNAPGWTGGDASDLERGDVAFVFDPLVASGGLYAPWVCLSAGTIGGLNAVWNRVSVPSVTPQERFAPKYMVGNTLSGDSAAAYSAGGFRYFPDPGDGSGIAAALSAAAVAPGDVCVRPGTYDFSLGVVATPLVVPPSVRLYGAGHANTLLVSKRTGNQGILRVTGGAIEIEGFGFSVLSASGGFTGQTAVLLLTGDGMVSVRRSSFSLVLDASSVMRACISSQGPTLDVVDCTGTGPARLLEESGAWVCFVITNNGLTRTTVQHARTVGFDTPVLVMDSSCLIEDLSATDWGLWAVYQEGAGGLGIETSVLAAETAVTGGVRFAGLNDSLQISSYLTTTSISGNSSLGPGIQIASGAAGGRIRVATNSVFWQRASGSAIEIGDGEPGGFSDSSPITANIINNQAVGGIGVRVRDNSCRRNNVSVNVINAAVPVENNSGTTQIVGNV